MAIMIIVSVNARVITSLRSEFVVPSERVATSLEAKVKENRSLRSENEMLKPWLQEMESSAHSTPTHHLSTPKSDTG